MTILAKKSLGVDANTGLTKELWVFDINISGRTDAVGVMYQIVLLSPTGKLVQVKTGAQYDRFDRPAELYPAGAVITPEVKNQQGEVITRAVIATGTEEIRPANLKFTYLKDSPVGQAILGMLANDLANVQSEETAAADLTQD